MKLSEHLNFENLFLEDESNLKYDKIIEKLLLDTNLNIQNSDGNTIIHLLVLKKKHIVLINTKMVKSLMYLILITRKEPFTYLVMKNQI